MNGRQQRGVAIITVMLMVALASIALISMVADQAMAVRLAGAHRDISQAQSMAVAGERFAAALLLRDRETGARGDSDSPEDDWANSLPPVPIDNATLTGCIYDLQGRFNLNNLLDAEGKPDALQMERLRRLLNALELSASLADALLDWIDDDLNPSGADGAEDDYYLSLDPPYRSANRPLTSLSELKLVRGLFEDDAAREARDKLLPHVSALPPGTPVNVNSATPAVLRSLANHLDEALAGELARDEDKRWEHFPACPPSSLEDLLSPTLTGSKGKPAFEKIDAFLEQAKKGEDEVLNEGLSVSSDFFQVRIEVALGAVNIIQFSQLQRAKNGASFVRQRAREAN